MIIAVVLIFSVFMILFGIHEIKDDDIKTIHRLQEECKEKSDIIFSLNDLLHKEKNKCQTLKTERNHYKKRLRKMRLRAKKAEAECEALKQKER